MDQICELDKCSGCGACSGVCPKSCIRLLPDKERCCHIYPVVDNDICINCGLCARICPVNSPVTFAAPTATYAAYVADDEICDASSSGGLAYSLASGIIESGGAVYGSVVRYGDDFAIVHDECNTLEELRRTQGSKYCQSKIYPEIYHKVQKNLMDGKEVVFVGTGCQVAGIRNYLRKDYPNLFTIDIICHGVPSLNILTDYLSKDYDLSEIKRLSFRGKNGFDLSGVYGIHNAPIYKPLRNSLYMMGFMKGLYYRDSCYECGYAQRERCGDITLGDFWGLKMSVSMQDRRSSGTSLVLVNTAKGQNLFDRIKDKLVFETRPLEEAIAGNPQLRRPSRRHYASALFRLSYPHVGMKLAAAPCLIREKLFYAYALPLLRLIKH